MQRDIRNKSWKQHPIKDQLYGLQSPLFKLSKLDEEDMRDTAGGATTNSLATISYEPLRMDLQV